MRTIIIPASKNWRPRGLRLNWEGLGNHPLQSKIICKTFIHRALDIVVWRASHNLWSSWPCTTIVKFCAWLISTLREIPGFAPLLHRSRPTNSYLKCEPTQLHARPCCWIIEFKPLRDLEFGHHTLRSSMIGTGRSCKTLLTRSIMKLAPRLGHDLQ